MVRYHHGSCLRIIWVISISFILVGIPFKSAFGENDSPKENLTASCTFITETEKDNVKALLGDLSQAFLSRDYEKIASLSCPLKRDRYRKLFKKYREEAGLIKLGESLKTAFLSSINKTTNGSDEQTAVLSLIFDNKKQNIELIKIDGVWLVSDLMPEIDANDKDGATPLHHAALHGNLVVVKNLLEFGANIEKKDKFWGLTPFELAIFNNELEVAKLLVEEGADTSAIDFNKDRPQNGFWITPLHWAVLLDQLEKANVLIENGTDVNVKNWLGATPLQWAAQVGASETIRFLVRKGADIKVKNLLSLAIKSDSLDSVNCLIQSGVDPDEKDSANCTPLHLAIQKNSPEIANLLIKSGADVNARSEFDKTPLHCAAFHNSLEITKSLIEQEARVDVTDKEGLTPLKDAVEGRADLELVKFLFEKSIGNHSKKELAQSCLPHALHSYKLDLVKYFIEQGANFNALDNQLGIFSFWSHSALNSNLEALAYMLEKGLDVNMKDQNGNTIFHFQGFRHPEIAKFLIRNGADINIKNKSHNTPLHCAVDAFSLNGVKFIVELGADFNIQDKEGSTPLQKAEHQLLQGKYSRYLLKELNAIIEFLKAEAENNK